MFDIINRPVINRAMSYEVNKTTRREKLKAEGWPSTLSELFERTGISFDHYVRMTIDVQQDFIVNPRMEDIVVHMRDNIAPAFNRIGLPTYWIYWPVAGTPHAWTREDLIRRDYREGAQAIYELWPALIDKVLPKHHSSAFKHGLGQNIDGPTLTDLVLYEDEVELLLVDGFFYDECVKRTIVDATERGYLVALLEDGTDGPNSVRLHEPDLVKAGVIFLNSDEAVTTLKRHALQNPTIKI